MRLATLLLFSCACLSGQPAAPQARDLAVSRETDAGSVTIHLRNEYSSPATAWILQCEVPQGGSRHHWNDQDLSFQTKPLNPGAETEFKIPPRPAAMMARFAGSGSCEDFHLIAAVFADGTVSGDLRWINAIVSERRQVYQDIGKAIEILNAAISGGSNTPAVVKQLTDWQKSSQPEGMALRPSPISGPSSGWQSNGTAPPRMRPFAVPVPSAALWLMDSQKTALPDAVKALVGWRERLAKLPAVTETGGPSPTTMPRFNMRPFSDPEMTGKPAPDFTLKDVDGHEFTLSSLRGKAVLLDFWATWCEPCREEMPHIQAVYDQFKDQGLVVVCIDTNETADKPKKYFEEQKYSFVNLLDSSEEVSAKYGEGSIPRTVLIDKDGVVRYFHPGWGSGMDLASEVRKLVE